MWSFIFFPYAGYYCTLYLWLSPPQNPGQTVCQKPGQQSGQKSEGGELLTGGEG